MLLVRESVHFNKPLHYIPHVYHSRKKKKSSNNNIRNSTIESSDTQENWKKKSRFVTHDNITREKEITARKILKVQSQLSCAQKQLRLLRGSIYKKQLACARVQSTLSSFEPRGLLCRRERRSRGFFGGYTILLRCRCYTVYNSPFK